MNLLARCGAPGEIFINKATLVAAGAALLSTCAVAAPTALGYIPIADILAHREIVYTFQTTGFEHRINPRYSWAHALQVGVFNRAEVGFDNDFLGNTVYNGKFQVFNEQQVKKTALSVGVWNYQHGKGDWDVVGRRDCSGYRLHCGYQQSDEGHLMAGIDAPWGNSIVSLDYNTGSHSSGFGTAAVTTPIKQVPGLSFMGVLTVPTDHLNGVQHTFVLIYDHRL